VVTINLGMADLGRDRSSQTYRTNFEVRQLCANLLFTNDLSAGARGTFGLFGDTEFTSPDLT
jgi:hypothetical protein